MPCRLVAPASQGTSRGEEKETPRLTLANNRSGPGESSASFAKRVQTLIAAKVGAQATDWDGYLKHWKPSKRYISARQQTFARALAEGLSYKLPGGLRVKEE